MAVESGKAPRGRWAETSPAVSILAPGIVLVFAAAVSISFGAERRFVSTEMKAEGWAEKFEHLRRLDRKLRSAFPEVFRDEPVCYERPPIAARSKTDLLEAMLGRELAMLSATVNRLAASRRGRPPAAVQTYLRKIRSNAAVYKIALPSTATIENISIRLANVGRTPVVNPRIVANGKRDWFDVRSILREALAGAKTDRDKAIAIWRFLAENRYHFTPAHPSAELHDPVRFLNVYGYGFCDDSAANFAALARSAGLGGRVWGLSGHVVAEAFYDGAWHLFDPDGKSYYLREDGRTIASVEDVARNPELLRRPVTAGRAPYSFDVLKKLYTTTGDNRVSDWYRRTSSTSHTMAFTLRPGETIVRCWRGRGRFFTSRYFKEPPLYGGGEWIYEVPFERALFRQGATKVEGIETVSFGDGQALAAAATTASFVHEFRLPYPILDGVVEIAYSSTEAGNKVAVSIGVGVGGGAEQPVWTGAGKGERRALVPVGCFFPNGWGDPVYSCRFRITLVRSGGRLAVRSLRYRLGFEVAPASLPALEPRVNEISYRDESASPPSVEIEHSYVVEKAK